MARFWMVVGAVSGLVAVAMAAYASHGMELERASLTMTGASLQAWHALALFGTGLLAERRAGALPHVAGGLFAFGSLAFCTGVYLRALAETSIGPVTPIGGLSLMAGWGVLAVAALLPPQR